MNFIINIQSIEKEVKIFLLKVQTEGLESGVNFYESKLEFLIDKVKKTKPDYYKKNQEYFIEIYEMLYVHPKFTNPVRNLSESISIVYEMIEKTE